MKKDPRLINCKTECGNIACYGHRFGMFAEKRCPNYFKPSVMTNADRIRAMTDEELATMIATLQIAQTMARQDETWWLEWLQSEEMIMKAEEKT